MRRVLLGLSVVWLLFPAAASVRGQEMPAEYKQVLTTLGKQGDYSANVLKVNIPRNDLHVTIAGVPTPTPFGFGGWLGMTKGDAGMDVMMGDLVLTEKEVNPVMSALLNHGLEVTALHNHFFYDQPHVYFMHVMGHGKPADLAERAKPAVDLIGKPGGKATAAAAATPAAPKIDTAKIDEIVGHKGDQTGPVYKITVGRDDVDLKMMGAKINARMGLNTWAAFAGSDQNAQVAGDVAMLQGEVQGVLKALRSHNLEVVAIHHHMLNTQPMIIFLHYWGRGPTDKLATGFRAALDQLGKH